MPDSTVIFTNVRTNAQVPQKFLDLGDGTFAAATALQPSESFTGRMGGTGVEYADTFARPADTTAYAANDRIGATVSNSGTTPLRQLLQARKNGGSGYLTGIRVWTNKTGITPRLRIHIYEVTAPPTAIPGDNDVFPVRWANRAARVGAIDLPAMSTPPGAGTDVSTTSALDVRIPFVCDAGDSKLYYAIQTLDAFTPDSGQQWFVECRGDLD